MNDLTELYRKLAELEKREKELELRVEELTDFIEEGSIPLHSVDGKGIIKWANQAELDLLGYSREEYIGFPISNFHAESSVINEILTRLTNNETLRNFPARLRCKDGSLKHVLINSNVLRENGKFIHTRCFTRDVTEFREQEIRKHEVLTKLEESEARLRMATASTDLGTWDLDLVSMELVWSVQCKKIYGLPPEAHITFDTFQSAIHPEDLENVQELISKAKDPAGDGRYDATFRIIRFDDGSTRWIRSQGKVFFNADRQASKLIGTAVDLTDIKLAQQKIERSEKLFKSIALNIPNSLIIVFDKDHRFVTVEGDLMLKMGFDSKNYEGKHPTEVAPPENYKATRHFYERVLEGEKFSEERKTAAGDDFIVHFVPLKNDADEVYAGLMIALDITEFKKAEEKSAKLAAIVESSEDAIISKTLEGIITSWNNSAQRIFGYTADEMIGHSVLKLIPENRAGEEPLILSKLRKGERVEHFETERLTKDKNLIDISLTLSPIKDLQGRITGISKIARDISAKKQAEKLIIQNEEHLRLAIKAADLGTFDIDLLTGEMIWDNRCRELYGINHNEPLTYPGDFLIALHEDDRERVKENLEKIFDENFNKGVYDVEYRTIGIDDKKLRWLRAMGQAFYDDNGNAIRFIGTVLDITDKKQEELRKNDFIAIVSHELKTPLTAVKSYVQILLQRALKDGDDFRVNALTRTEIQANKMTSLIQDFLSLARLEEGKVHLNKESFDLNPLIEEIVNDARCLTSNHEIIYTASEVAVINADQDKIGQVLMNLVSNAVKYSPDGGRIIINMERTPGKVTISISDEGIGINTADQARLFDRFYRVNNEKLKTVSGFGIGLYLVSEILRYHNSKIQVESKEGRGSKFFFSMDTL